MATEIWIYEGRNSAAQAFWNFEDARREQDDDNGCTPEQARAEGFEVGGSEAEGYFYIDDGGAITKVTVIGEPGQPEKPVLPPVEFSVGNPVRCTTEWAVRYNKDEVIRGRVGAISDFGPMNEKRRVRVDFDEPVFWDFKFLWFDPDELELDV